MNILLMLFILCEWLPTTVMASPAEIRQSHKDSIAGSILKAGHAVEEAWKTFHQAALGGTLVSPVVQAQIEQDLHRSRALLVQAREAAEQFHFPEVERLTASINFITERIKRDSQRQKL